MHPAFDRATPVVDFRATSRPLRWGARQWVLWPAYTFRVLIATNGAPGLNLFQKAVLGLCGAGVRESGEITERLAFRADQADLVAFVLVQLKEMGLLGGSGELTQRARRMLDEMEDEAFAEESGYVLVDGHTLRLWPRLHRGPLPYADAEFESETQARLHRGTLGRPDTVSAKSLVPHGGMNEPAPPSGRDILKVARQHQRRLRAFAREVGADSDSELSQLAANATPKRVRLVGAVPEPVLVAVCIFVPDNHIQQTWLITDPCGLGVTDILRGAMADLAESGSYHAKRTLENLMGEAWHVDPGDLAHYLEQAQKRGLELVQRLLGPAATVLPREVVERLADAEERFDAALQQSSGATSSVESYVGNVYAALEGVFGWLVAMYPDTALLTVLTTNAAVNARTLGRLAKEIGFDVPDEATGLLNVPRQIVKGVLCHGNRSLPGRLGASLIAASRNCDHPLRTLARRNPAALLALARLSELRPDAQHNTSDVLTSDDARMVREDLFGILRALVGEGPAVDETALTSAGPTWGADFNLRLRARAEELVKHFPNIDEFPDLRSRVIDLNYNALWVALLDRAENVSSDSLATRLRDFIVTTAIALEAALAEIERIAPSDANAVAGITDDRGANASLIAGAAVSLGFQTGDSGMLPEDLTYARSSRIRKASQGEAETLSARLVAQILTAANHPGHPLREVAATRPSLLLDIGRVVAAREHGDNVKISVPDAKEIEQIVREDLASLLLALA
jgi:hypothetical protein